MTEYRPSLSYPQYLAGADGTIIGPRGWVLRPQRQKNGYLYINVHFGKRQIHARVHVLVCEAWHGVRPLGAHAAHKDGDQDNNDESNICWKTLAENHADKIRHGTSGLGEKNNLAKLTPDKVIRIRFLYMIGSRTYTQLAQEMSVTPSNIYCIVNRKSWSHI